MKFHVIVTEISGRKTTADFNEGEHALWFASELITRCNIAEVRVVNLEYYSVLCFGKDANGTITEKSI